MVVALDDIERAFVPPQHFIRLVQRRMERQPQEDEIKNRSSKKGQEAEQAISNRATSPDQSGSQESQGSLKAMKEKSSQPYKDAKGGSSLLIAGPNGEITAEFLEKRRAKTKEWSGRWFVLNEKSRKLGYKRSKRKDTFVVSSLWSGQSIAQIEELLLEDQNVKRRREQFQTQSSLMSKLSLLLSVHNNRASSASWSEVGTGADFDKSKGYPTKSSKSSATSLSKISSCMASATRSSGYSASYNVCSASCMTLTPSAKRRRA